MTVLAILEGSAFCGGMAMGAASILSVGPNNVTLLREGIVGGRVGLVATTVWTSRLVLLVTALLLTETIAVQGAFLRPTLSWLGLVTLSWFAYSSLRTYFRADKEIRLADSQRENTMDCLRRVLMIFWFNPLTYVEMLFIPATVGGSFILPICRALFIGGLIVMATASCYGYAFGGRLVEPLFRRKSMLRMFDLTSGILLSCMAGILAIALVVQTIR